MILVVMVVVVGGEGRGCGGDVVAVVYVIELWLICGGDDSSPLKGKAPAKDICWSEYWFGQQRGRAVRAGRREGRRGRRAIGSRI